MEEILNFHKYLDPSSSLNAKKLEELANRLMKEYCIKKQNAFYQIAEIEFYFYSKKHRDIITYPRTCPMGSCFFHQSGVDLTIESSEEGENPCFGGILIRSIRKYDKDGKYKETICGPLKCVYELFDVLDAVNSKNNLTPVFEKHDFGNIEVDTTQRYIPLNVSAKDLKDGIDEKIAIKEKAKTKLKNILSENKKRAKGNQEWLIASDEDNSFECFQNYLTAKYRFYLKGIEWGKGYNASKLK